MTTTRRVRVSAGTLHVIERGQEHDETIVLVHGYPDSAHLWDAVADRLDVDHHVVAYDVRGAGASSAPADRSGYRMAALLADLEAVITATSPDRPVHLVGHDWGAIQGFAAVRTPALASRLASFTAVSAPGTEVARWWLRARLGERSPAAFGQVAGQAARSWYIAAFQLPVLPERLVRLAGDRILRRGGHPAPSPTLREDAVRGIDLYRANGAAPLRAPVGELPSAPPVRVLTGRHDPFVSPRIFDDLRDRLGVPVTEVHAGHWLPLTDPDLVAEHVRAAVAEAR